MERQNSIRKPPPQEDQRRRLYERIDSQVVRKVEPAYCFIIQSHLESIWDDPALLEQILYSNELESLRRRKGDLKSLQARFYKLMTILLLIGAADKIVAMISGLSAQRPSKDDADIPLIRDELAFLGDPRKIDDFLAKQYWVIPFVINGREKKQRVDPFVRLPFISQTKYERGGYGEIFCVKIPRDNIKYLNGDGPAEKVCMTLHRMRRQLTA